jgi:mannose-6-phosphate isomerase-like protein (cupin superfamily)
MKNYALKNFTNGWFMGRFNPSLFSTDIFEVAVKYYKMGDTDPAHYHKVSREFTVVVSGSIQMNDKYFSEGDIIEVDQDEVIEFLAVTDATIVVVKVPSGPGDKYLK